MICLLWILFSSTYQLIVLSGYLYILLCFILLFSNLRVILKSVTFYSKCTMAVIMFCIIIDYFIFIYRLFCYSNKLYCQTVLDFILIYKLLYLSYKIVNSRLVVILYQLNMLYKLLISVYFCCFYLFTKPTLSFFNSKKVKFPNKVQKSFF